MNSDRPQKRAFQHGGKSYKPPVEKALNATGLADPIYRLDNLYHIVNKQGKLVRFRMNPIQRHFVSNLWYWNCILKARQLGFTTLIELWGFDKALFVPNTHMTIIAHRKDDAASIMENKIEIPYENLHPAIKDQITLEESNKSSMTFSNGSSISVTTSGRSGTSQILHISELGYTSKHRPDVANEIITGSLPAVHAGSFVFVESTAEGSTGEFHDICQSAMNRKRERRKLTPREFKFHFYGWHQEAENRLSDEDTALVVISDRLMKYFAKLEKDEGIVLDPNQRAWYAAEDENLQDKMKQENPSTPEEAFENSGDGNYFLRQMKLVREDERIGDIPHQPGRLVNVFFDIGVNDPTAVWFIQSVGPWNHALYYYENVDNGMDYHVEEVKKIASENGWALGKWYGPHDLEHREKKTAISLREEIAKMGVEFVVVPRVLEKITSITVARRMLATMRFDRAGCELGIKRLDNYTKKWDSIRGVWADKPLHDENSDGADAFQCFAMAMEGNDLDSQIASKVQADPRRVAANAAATGVQPAPKNRRMRGFTV